MFARYEPLPNIQPNDHETDAAGSASDEDDDGNSHASESRPLRPPSASRDSDAEDSEEDNDAIDHPLAVGSSAPKRESAARSQSQNMASTSNSSNGISYDAPPPGSPPRLDRALPNDYGNTNGIVSSSPLEQQLPNPSRLRRLEWVRRFLPTSVANRVIDGSRRGSRFFIRGFDGVFANMAAKPSVQRWVQDENGVYVLPEESQAIPPPSYATAQADAVPPYWESAIHAPSSLSPGMMIPGELPVDGLATGTLFSFLWNMLVSISFQFVGFLLTYLLHTTHAAKLGARAGLGLTLVQYGFTLRSGKEDYSGGTGGTAWNTDKSSPPPMPSFPTAADADSWYSSQINGTSMPDTNPSPPKDDSIFSGDMTSEWFAFLLMTIGWFILLNSLLNFWRIKRWERSVLSQHAEHPEFVNQPIATGSSGTSSGQQSNFARQIERTLGLRIPTARMFRFGLGLRGTSHQTGADERSVFEHDEGFELVPTADRDLERGDSLDESGIDSLRDAEREFEMSIPADHPDRERLIIESLTNERRVREDLRAAGLL